MPGLRKDLQQGDRVVSQGTKFGKLIRVKVSDDTKVLLSRVSKSSSRPIVDVVCAAMQNYLQNPAYYRPHIINSDEELTTVVSVRVSRRAADFFLDETFVSPVSWRRRFIGIVVGVFLRRYPFKDLVTALHAYADVIGPILRRRHHGRHEPGD